MLTNGPGTVSGVDGQSLWLKTWTGDEEAGEEEPEAGDEEDSDRQEIDFFNLADGRDKEAADHTPGSSSTDLLIEEDLADWPIRCGAPSTSPSPCKATSLRPGLGCASIRVCSICGARDGILRCEIGLCRRVPCASCALLCHACWTTSCPCCRCLCPEDDVRAEVPMKGLAIRDEFRPGTRLGPRVCERCFLPFFSDLDFFVCVSCLRGICGVCAEGCFDCLRAFCHGHCRCFCSRPADASVQPRAVTGLGIPAKPASPRCAECRLAFPVPEWRCAECSALLHQACLASHDEVCQGPELFRCGTRGPAPALRTYERCDLACEPTMHRPLCGCRCGCRRRPGRLVLCVRCGARIGPGCCLALESRKRSGRGLCHACHDGDPEHECGALPRQPCLAPHDEVCQGPELSRCGTGGPAPAPLATPLPARLRRPPGSRELRRPPSPHGPSCICDGCLDYGDDRD